jgi:hypothetical protein
VKLDAEMAVIERRVMPAVALVAQRERDVVAEEIDARDLPSALRRAAPIAGELEQALAGRDEKGVAHSAS